MVSSRPYRSFFRRMDNFVFIKKVMSLFLDFYFNFLDDGSLWKRAGNDLAMGVVSCDTRKYKSWFDDRFSYVSFCHVWIIIYLYNRLDIVYYESHPSM